MTVNIIMSHGAMGADENDDLLDNILRKIAMTHGDEKSNWVSKYGVDFENDIFMMHPYCWCEREDECPWCGGCNCPESAFHYFVDEKEISYEEFQEFFDKETFDKLGIPREISCIGKNHDNWMKLADKANLRRKVVEDMVCDYCKGTGMFALHGGEPRRGAPNFWYKPTNFKVWWYKYIGRDTEINHTITEKELNKILEDCIK